MLYLTVSVTVYSMSRVDSSPSFSFMWIQCSLRIDYGYLSVSWILHHAQ